MTDKQMETHKGRSVSGSAQSKSGKRDAREASKLVVEKVVQEACISDEEARQMRMLGEAILDPYDFADRCSLGHPNAAGTLVHQASAPQEFSGSYSATVDNGVVTTNNQGCIVVASNRGIGRIWTTANSSGLISVNNFTIDEYIDIPGGAIVSSAGAVTPPAQTRFLGGMMQFGDSNSGLAQLPVLSPFGQAGPKCGYFCSTNGTNSFGVYMRCTGFHGKLCFRPWYLNSGNVWVAGTWQVQQTVDSTPFGFNFAAALIIGIALEVCATIGSSAGINISYPSVIGSPAVQVPSSELLLQRFDVSWWEQITFSKYLTIAGGEVVTCTGTDLTAGGDIAVGVPSYGTAFGDLPAAANYFSSITTLVDNRYVGNLKFGGSAFHVPTLEDRAVRPDTTDFRDYRIYAIRSATVPTLQIKSNSLFSLQTNSSALHPVEAPFVPHAMALYQALTYFNRTGDNADHLKWLRQQAEKFGRWIVSDSGKKAIAKGVGLAKEVAKLAPTLATLLV